MLPHRCQSSVAIGLLGMLILVMLTGWGCQPKAYQEIPPKSPPQEIRIQYTWVGLAPESKRELFTLRLSKDKRMYYSSGQLTLVPLDISKVKKQKTFDTQVSVESVRQILQAIREEQWQAAKQPGERIDHTDDYPNCTLEFTLSKGRTFKLASTSNTPNGVPWNLYFSDSLHVTSGALLSPLIQTLLVQVRPATSDGWQEMPVDKSTSIKQQG